VGGGEGRGIHLDMSEPPAARPADSRSRLAIRGDAVRISGAALTSIAGTPAEDGCFDSVDDVFDHVDEALVPVDGVFDELLLTLADSLAAAMVLEVNGVAVESVFGSVRLVLAVLFVGLHNKKEMVK
jgi:hypothetical protein